MNQRQRSAYRNPAMNPFGLVNPLYAKDIRIGKLRLSTVLTCSVLAGEYTWHASISVLNRRFQPTPADSVSETDFEIIKSKLDELLEGVGDHSVTSYEQSASAFHISRPLTAEEITGLPQQAHAQNN